MISLRVSVVELEDLCDRVLSTFVDLTCFDHVYVFCEKLASLCVNCSFCDVVYFQPLDLVCLVFFLDLCESVLRYHSSHILVLFFVLRVIVCDDDEVPTIS
ncbi:hypothetical protein Leryth_004604 [Lithospermum erythrorhizon]|nr:hypothetical protein Leryth_004604 [Lithospermum erythrorhizon]